VRSPFARLGTVPSLLGLCVALLAPSADALTVAGFGDSMTWPPGYLAALPAEWQTVNLSLGGEASWNGLPRLEGLLPTLHADVLILMEGTNDVRDPSYSLQRSVDSLTAMVDAARAADIAVVLMAPPPLKPSYPNAQGYDALLASLSDALKVQQLRAACRSSTCSPCSSRRARWRASTKTTSIRARRAARSSPRRPSRPSGRRSCRSRRPLCSSAWASPGSRAGSERGGARSTGVRFGGKPDPLV
jgi:GDSL-like Lipase/Acylhydrolase family